MQTNKFDSLRLRPISKEDYIYVLNWSKDENFCLANGWELNKNEEELYNWWLRCVTNQSEHFIRLGIEFNENLIGYAYLANIMDNTAEIGIAIGESRLWGKGIGFMASLCLINYASNELKLTNTISLQESCLRN